MSNILNSNKVDSTVKKSYPILIYLILVFCVLVFIGLFFGLLLNVFLIGALIISLLGIFTMVAKHIVLNGEQSIVNDDVEHSLELEDAFDIDVNDDYFDRLH